MSFKNVIVGIVSLLALAPFAASAATFSNVQFQNGDVVAEGAGGTTVNATFHIVVGSNEVVEQIQTDVISDNLAPVCTSVGDNLGLQQGTHDVQLQIKLPPNTGTYTLNVQGSGIYGAFRADDCVGDVVGSASFNNALRVISSSGSSSGNTNTGGVQAQIDALAASVKSLTDALATFLSGNAGGTATGQNKAKCDAIAPYRSAPAGTYSAAGTQLQSALLLDNPYSIPALKPGSTVPMGYRGPQTEAALSAYLSMYHCS